MHFLQAIILGIIEGVTEYLPISSTFHLIWSSKLLQIPDSDFLKLFEVFVQSGAILAVVILYFKTLTHDWQTLKKLALSFVPTAVVGLVLFKIIKNVFFVNSWLQLAVFALVGIIFIVYEKFFKKNRTKTIANLTYPQAVIIGLCQSLAVVPGVSRAGAVMLAMLAMDINREEAAKYSFLLAVPTLCAAAALDLLKSRELLMGQLGNVGLLATGFVAAFISAFVVVKWFITFLQKHDLSSFGWYRLVIVALILVSGL